MMKKTSPIPDLLTPFCPDVLSYSTESSLKHPGVGLTKQQMLTVQKQVRADTEPWKTYFEDMLASESAQKTPPVQLTDPSSAAFSSRGTNSRFIRDGLTAYTQAILYLVTGDTVYRQNALTILRVWSSLNPDEFAYFPDAHIHVGIPMNRMCIAAEMIRCTSFPAGETDLLWRDDEIEQFRKNLLRPAIRTFLSDCSGFMNQHLYTVIGAMSAYLFLDDWNGYAKTVEWFTVNRNAANPGFNGSIRRLFRKITTLDEAGQPEGSGIPLPHPVVQHVEMGRDQAHGCGDLTNAAILARMMLAQETAVDPVTGTVSDADNAVGIYEFDDDRILTAADFFFRYMLGYDSEWVQVPFSVRNGVIADNYTAFSPNYRGRYRTINFWDLYVYYTYRRKDVDLAKDYPYFYEGFMKKVPSLYYAGGRRVVNWDNVDGGGDFWLFLPECAAGNPDLPAKKQVHYRSEAEDRGSMVKNPGAMSVCEDNGTGYIRFRRSEQESTLAMTDSGTDRKSTALRIRTDGTAKLKISFVKDPILLPDTCGLWKYVICTCGDTESFGDFYTVTASDITGSYVDLDAVDIKPDEANEDRAEINILRFTDGTGDFSQIAYKNAPVHISFSAENSIAEHPVRYAGGNLPEGAVPDETAGILSWTPRTEGKYDFLVTAAAGDTVLVRRAVIEVCPDRRTALEKAASARDPGTPYTRSSLQKFRTALDAAESAAKSAGDEEFSILLGKLCRAGAELEPLSPKLTDDPLTDGTSLDYGRLVQESTMGDELCNLIDPEGTFCGYYKAVDKAHVMDFGENYRIAVSKFGYQARLGFSDRLAGVQVFGSSDGEVWACLTEREAEYTQQYHEIAVKAEEQHNHYRYLKIRKTTEYPDALRGNVHGLLEFGVLRIYGTRYEI